MDPYIGELRCFGFNFAPAGWFQCNGQTLAISQYTALFSILGVNFGGNGTTNFQLPNLQGMVPISQGTGPGLSPFVVGETGGTPTHTLLTSEMPAHPHPMTAAAVEATLTTPAAGGSLAQGHGGGRGSGFQINTFTAQTRTTTLNPAAVGTAGSGTAHDNMQPSLVMNWCIAWTGIFPPRS